MKKTYLLLLLLNWFSIGLIVPVLSLIFIDKGCTLPQIAILIGFSAFTVILLELPSGILSDLLGRKKVFMLSCAMNVIASIAMLCLSGFALLIPAVIIMGAGRAFSTGSVDAMLIDDTLARKGSQSLSHATTAIALTETIGISAGAIIGGFLPDITKNINALGTFDLNLILRCILYAVILIITFAYIKENHKHADERIGIKEHLLTGFKFIKSSPTVILLAISMLMSGLFIAPVESYWQPVYTSLLPSGNLFFTIGLISFGCFAFAALGSIVAKRFMRPRIKSLSFKYTLARITLFSVFIIFSLQKTVIGFGGMFMLVYFLFAGSNVIDSTMLNMQIPSKLRSSMLSFVSLIFQGGCLLSPLFSTFAVTRVGIEGLWLYLGIALLIGVVIIGVGLYRAERKAEVLKTDE